MSKDALTTYLNDHLAGAAAALELLDHLISLERGADRRQELVTIRDEVEQDQQVLLRMLRAVGGKESRVRSALAWLTEKIGQAKLRLDDPGGGEFRVFEALEALALGIQGKAALWRALASSSAHLSELRTLDYGALERRAIAQFTRVDNLRLQVAPAALSS
ncbi:MAG: hypothetical protein ACJ8BF_06470 [Gemmatimonadales bacterium]